MTRPLFTVAICTGREESEAFFYRWLSLHRALKTGDTKAVPADVQNCLELQKLLLDCIDLRDGSFIVPTLRSLANQTFRDFDVLLVDCAAKNRPPFRIPDGIPTFHAMPPRDTPWLHESWPDGFEPCPPNWQMKWPIGAAARNTAIVHARGERLIFLDDCMLVGPDFLQAMVDILDEGVLPTATGRTQLVWPDHGVPLCGGRHQWEPWIERDKIEEEEETSWGSHVGCPWPLEAWLAVNGFDETFDPVLSLEDEDVRCRLRNYMEPRARADERLRLWELGHYHFHWMRFAARHNGVLAEMIRDAEGPRIRANDSRPDTEFWAEYKRRVTSGDFNCSLTPNFALTAPPFDLIEERREAGR